VQNCLINLDPDAELMSGRTASDPVEIIFSFFWPALRPQGCAAFLMSSLKGKKRKKEQKPEARSDFQSCPRCNNTRSVSKCLVQIVFHFIHFINCIQSPNRNRNAEANQADPVLKSLPGCQYPIFFHGAVDLSCKSNLANKTPGRDLAP